MKRVLVIDDCAVVRQAAGGALARAGFSVVEVSDGLAAIAVLGGLTPRDPPITAVLCDLEMPRLDGVATVHALRADPRWHALPIIMLARDGVPELIERATRAGAQGFIRKPFDELLLVTAVQRLTA